MVCYGVGGGWFGLDRLCRNSCPGRSICGACRGTPNRPRTGTDAGACTGTDACTDADAYTNAYNCHTTSAHARTHATGSGAHKLAISCNARLLNSNSHQQSGGGFAQRKLSARNAIE